MSELPFYSDRTQPVIGPVVRLPQRGASSGGSHRPLNSYAILGEQSSILFDAPFTWVLDGVRALASEGHPPTALVLSHGDLLTSGDAFDLIIEEFSVPVLMHPADDRADLARHSARPFENPVEHPLLLSENIEVIHLPGHSSGSVMLYLHDEGGILLAGDSAVGPGPDRDPNPPRLQRPKMFDVADFSERMQVAVARYPLAAVLPLHGAPYRRSDLGDAQFDTAVEYIWAGKAMDPSSSDS